MLTPSLRFCLGMHVMDNRMALPTSNMALQAFGAIWWVGFGDKNPQLPRVMVLPVDISDNIAVGPSGSGM